VKKLSLIGMVALAVLTTLPARSDETQYGAYATSPAHPATWVDGATRVHQDLRWDEKSHLLVTDVQYSTRIFADATHPPEEDDFILPFPSVHFNPATNTFTANGVAIGKLRKSFFGHEVVLSPGIALSIHRHHGVVHAAIIPDDGSQY
jgi:hypothetical protein